MKKRISKLALKRETLAALDLQNGRVAGGASTLCNNTWNCPSDLLTVTCGGNGGQTSQGPSCAASGCTQQN